MWAFIRFSHVLLPYKKHCSKWIGYTKLPLGVNVCAWCFIQGVFPASLPSVPGISSRSTAILTRIKELLWMNKLITVIQKINRNHGAVHMISNEVQASMVYRALGGAWCCLRWSQNRWRERKQEKREGWIEAWQRDREARLSHTELSDSHQHAGPIASIWHIGRGLSCAAWLAVNFLKNCFYYPCYPTIYTLFVSEWHHFESFPARALRKAKVWHIFQRICLNDMPSVYNEAVVNRCLIIP